MLRAEWHPGYIGCRLRTNSRNQAKPRFTFALHLHRGLCRCRPSFPLLINNFMELKTNKLKTSGLAPTSGCQSQARLAPCETSLASLTGEASEPEVGSREGAQVQSQPASGSKAKPTSLLGGESVVGGGGQPSVGKGETVPGQSAQSAQGSPTPLTYKQRKTGRGRKIRQKLRLLVLRQQQRLLL